MMMIMMMMMMMKVYAWHFRQFINLYNILKLVEINGCYSISIRDNNRYSKRVKSSDLRVDLSELFLNGTSTH